MRIGDAAAAAGTTPRALRLYEQRGLLPPPARTSSGQREYGPRDIARIRLVRQLLALGLTIEDVARCADRLHLLEGDTLPPYGSPGCSGNGDGNGDGSGGGRRVVQRRIAALDAEIARLTDLRNRLASAIAGPERTDHTDRTERTERADQSRSQA
ncbi:MerR family transcriptional regulator [Microbispora sp. SCL1-1]|jgi:DNA-binding transcriptional MerR regulator|uniref:MerR family transcriptional regulator n=1 Tax=Microbispora TaxID=2005 RepID=UPI001158F457|nr:MULTISPECIES: MerR family transcriptional regulator [unclassified Microbispora]NJP24263.1 MerR family transcriptional regulator [Microbispora sp. CL1-1]TQS15059.1 MerR family transcriptional regulator [Microbispora sp. SCL1-1]